MISALATEQQHIPYRNHKLTMLMSDSLGGNAKTLMFVNVRALGLLLVFVLDHIWAVLYRTPFGVARSGWM